MLLTTIIALQIILIQIGFKTKMKQKIMQGEQITNTDPLYSLLSIYLTLKRTILEGRVNQNSCSRYVRIDSLLDKVQGYCDRWLCGLG